MPDPLMTLVDDAPSSRQVEDLLQPHRRLIARLRRSEALSTGDVEAALRQMTELASTVLRVERVSVWRLCEGGGRIECLDLYSRRTGSHEKGMSLGIRQGPTYFAALDTERCIAAHDARTDPRTTELFQTYLEPLGIGAMLDAPVFLHGQMVGVVCHEHVGAPRYWRLWEELLAGTLSDFVAHVMEAEERAVAQAEVARYRAHLEALVEARTKELRASEQSFRDLFEASPTALVLSRVPDGRLVLINSRARQMMQLPSSVGNGEIDTARFYESLEDRDRILEDVRCQGFVDGRETRMRTFDGQPRWCQISARVITYDGEMHIAAGLNDVSGLKDIEQRLREAAMKDPLTGAFNRRHLFDVGAGELERARRYDRSLAVAIFDADHFKQKNDRHGHAVGDEILVLLSKIARSQLRQSDVLARFGGEEFVVLFPETSLDDAFSVTERLRERVAAAPVETAAGPVAQTISAGVVAWDRSESLAQMIERADRALYRAKESGRNRTERG
ncbi:Diguanylate cyclase/phosphodiesterase domain 1 [Labilithrix luteola]|uniref:diguanylate cyclase n=1 Tax=Labilithrix luteola TaxID=1391654 RepID=A0A0K1QFZ9_9BACT|nr:Diguanylate cyclase/phosphodiesterase domain 1 [Labilithrix luteola]